MIVQAMPYPLPFLPIPEGIEAGSLIVSLGGSGAWDEGGVREFGNVLHDPDDTGKEYKLTYSGFASGADEFAVGTVFVGYAYSSDGVTWTKATTASPLIARSLEDPWVIKVGDTYYLYAEDKADDPFRNIRCYTSTDFSSWSDQGDVFDIGTTGQWDDTDVSSPIVWKNDDGWHMLFEGRAATQRGAIGYATSSDGMAWTRDSFQPVFVGTNTSWGYGGVTWADAVVTDDLIIRDDGLLILIFHGRISTGPDTWRIGVAVGRDVYSFEDALGAAVSLTPADNQIQYAAPLNKWIYFDTPPDGIYLSSATDPLNAAPDFSVDPAISEPSGFVGIGDTLTCDGGSHDGLAPAFQWRRDGSNITGATGSTYTLQNDDLAANITCKVTVVTSGGTRSAVSNSLGPVVSPVFATETRTLSNASNRTLSDAADRTLSNRTA